MVVLHPPRVRLGRNRQAIACMVCHFRYKSVLFTNQPVYDSQVPAEVEGREKRKATTNKVLEWYRAA